VLRWAREKESPWDSWNVLKRRSIQAPVDVVAGTGARLPVGCGDCSAAAGWGTWKR
jgi:hypothetical protein